MESNSDYFVSTNTKSAQKETKKESLDQLSMGYISFGKLYSFNSQTRSIKIPHY